MLGSKPSSSTYYYIALFGAFSITNGSGEDCTPVGQNSKAILAMLALARNGRRSRAWIQDRLWSQRPQKQGRASLRQELTNLRKHFAVFGIIPIKTSGDDVMLDAVFVEVDVYSHETPPPHLDLLEGFDGTDPEFNEWISEERAFWYSKLDKGEAAKLAARADKADVLSGHLVFPRLAVRKVKVLGQNDWLDHFGEGICDELRTSLSAISGVYRIVSPSADGAEAATDYMLNVSVRSANGVRVHAEAIKTDGGEQIWSGRFDLEEKADFEVQEKLARQIIDSILESLSDGQWVQYWATSETTTAAWEHFQKGRVQEQLGERVSLAKAISHYRIAAGLDASFLQAQISLGFCLVDGLRLCLFDDDEKAQVEAKNIVQKVRNFAPRNLHGRALNAFYYCYEGMFDQSLEIMQDVHDRAPTSPEMLGYFAAVLGYCGEYEKEQAIYKHALSLTSHPPAWIRTNLAFSCLLSGVNVDERELKNIIAEKPNHLRALVALAACQASSGAFSEAKETSSKILAIDPLFRANEWRSDRFFKNSVDQTKLAKLLSEAGLPLAR